VRCCKAKAVTAESGSTSPVSPIAQWQKPAREAWQDRWGLGERDIATPPQFVLAKAGLDRIRRGLAFCRASRAVQREARRYLRQPTSVARGLRNAKNLGIGGPSSLATWQPRYRRHGDGRWVLAAATTIVPPDSERRPDGRTEGWVSQRVGRASKPNFRANSCSGDGEMLHTATLGIRLRQQAGLNKGAEREGQRDGGRRRRTWCVVNPLAPHKALGEKAVSRSKRWMSDGAVSVPQPVEQII